MDGDHDNITTVRNDGALRNQEARLSLHRSASGGQQWNWKWRAIYDLVPHNKIHEEVLEE